MLSNNVDYTFTPHTDKYIDVWYRPPNLTKLNMVYGDDTIKTRINLRALESLEEDLSVSVSHPKDPVGLHPTDRIVLELDYPIDSIVPNLITLRDTVNQVDLIFDAQPIEDQPTQVALLSEYAMDQTLELLLLPGAIRDLWGHSHDSTTHFVSIGNTEDFGTLELQFSQLDSTVANYHISLLDSKDKILQSSSVYTDSTIVVSELYPGSYKLEIIEDLDNNGQWSAGNYLKKVQSEKFFEVPLDEVKGNWTVEKEIILNALAADSNTLPSSDNDIDESTESDEPE